MIQFPDPKEFQWDRGNVKKNWIKHNITTKESEEVFLDENLLFLQDEKHSKNEERFMIIGKTSKARMLSVIFTTRNNKIRIVSARTASRKERKRYEKT